ncbi:uncharacterized protein JCM10292_003182 [Rhodotorula paludigena]|uniref:uncharacterized protein n=1 Tax=Rhodotorula paludigena TaxID=86838 RepID=UPI00317F63FB
MNQDILPHVPATLPVVVLDHILGTLTHTSPTRRRGALVLVLVALFLGVQALSALRSTLNAPRIPPVPQWELDDALAAAYVPTPPTAQQRANHLRLSSLIESRRSAYPAALFTEAALAAESSPVVGVTAVILHWKRRKGLDLVLRHITRYPFIREVIVWNNRPGVDLSVENITLSTPPGSRLPPAELRIVNSPSNVHDAGKHLACSMASHEHCYFNDDDWLNVYMDTTYTKYLECCAGRGSAAGGGRIASNTLPIIHLEHRRWRFDNPTIDLHTGFTWLGTGSFAPRHLSRRFMQQQAATPLALSRDQSLVADMFFSLWTNAYPEQMPNDLVPIDVEGGEVGWSRGVDQWAVVYGNIRSAVRTLYTILSLSSPSLVPTLFSTAPPPPESHTRAPCANDACLFVTSLTPFPPPSALRTSYAASPAGSRTGPGSVLGRAWRAVSRHGGGGNVWHLDGGAELRSHRVLLRERERELESTEGLERGFDPTRRGWTVREHEARFNELEREGGRLGGGRESAWPGDEWWMRNGSWHLAVDGRGTDTCWESFRAPEADDHFGLTLAKPRAVRQLTIVGSPDLANIRGWEDLNGGGDSWEVLTVRGDGTGGWEPRSLLSRPRVVPLSSSLVSVTLSLDPIHTPTTYALRDEGNYEVDEEGREVAIRKVKIVSRGRKRERVRVCAWELDGWKF